MYIIPGYVVHHKHDGATILTSKIKQNSVKLTDPAIQKEFDSIIKQAGCPDISTPLTQFLHEQEMLANEQEICQTLQQVKNLLNDTLILTIMPTEGCNFRCTYCYEDHTPISMTQTMIDQLKNFLSEQVSHFKHVHISWFGGEPSLCKDTILDISSLIQSLQNKYHFQYTASMTTNGYLLSESTFRKFFAAGIKCYQITLDGHNHDKTRPHISGNGTLQRIINNLSEISKLPSKEFDFYIILRHNILAKDNDLSWYDYLYRLFGSDRRFAVSVRPVNNWGGDNITGLSLLDGENKVDLPKIHEDYVNQIGMRYDSSEDSLFGRICYAAFPNGYIIRADGKIEKCSVALNHPQNLVGYIDSNNGVVIDHTKNKLWSDAKFKSECYICPDILSCLNLQCRRYALVDKQRCYCHRVSYKTNNQP